MKMVLFTVEAVQQLNALKEKSRSAITT